MEKNSKKKFLIGALAVLLVAICVGGTVAWLSSQSQLTNSFTVGDINDPTKDPDGGDVDGETPNLDGNLYEPSWVDQSKIIPGSDVAKDPTVGIGPDSEDAYVFLFVKSMTTAEGKEAFAPTFDLNTGWSAVAGEVDGSEGAYTGGLFVYGTEAAPTKLSCDADVNDGNAWTNAAFDSVLFPGAADMDAYTDNPTIEVYSYVISAENASDAVSAAKTWAADFAA